MALDAVKVKNFKATVRDSGAVKRGPSQSLWVTG